ncbi:MAG: hypothetical protein GY851_10310 [bacterium]|nr:hypothetical protein [bacterium]
MGVTILVLFILSWVAVIVGIVWTIVRHGEHQRRGGSDVGEEMVASMMHDVDDGATVVEKTGFKGEAVAVGGQSEFSFGEIKQAVLQGNWSFVLPILTAFAGMLGVFVTASLGMFFYVNKVVGLLFIGATIYAVVQTTRGFRRA